MDDLTKLKEDIHSVIKEKAQEHNLKEDIVKDIAESVAHEIIFVIWSLGIEEGKNISKNEKHLI